MFCILRVFNSCSSCRLHSKFQQVNKGRTSLISKIHYSSLINSKSLTNLYPRYLIPTHHQILYSTSSSSIFEKEEKLKTVPSFLSEINLTEDENELIEMFKNLVLEEKLSTTVRIAGGWVRDKLLGNQGKDDIDVVLDDISGKDFANLLSSWIEKKGFKSVKVAM